MIWSLMQDEVRTVLLEMASLLREHYDVGWGEVYELLARSILVAPEDTARTILASYGGMGPINDVVLTSSGKPLLEENRRFDTLRSHLSQLCIKRLNGSGRSGG